MASNQNGISNALYTLFCQLACARLVFNPLSLEWPVSATPLIGVGLANLIAAVWIPALPVSTGLAILTLGATNATLVRFRRAPTAVPVLYLHAAAYVGLYVLFIGAVLHAAAGQPTNGLAAIATLDIAASTIPMAIALKRIAISLRGQFESQP